MEAHEIGNLIASSKVEGTAVYNTAGESLGEIDDLMIDKSSGKVAYAIMSFGGFLGHGKPIPSTAVVGPQIRRWSGRLRGQSR